MTPAIKTILGVILLVVGLADLLSFGWALLLESPVLILGILFTAGGAALLSSARRNRLLPP